MKKVLIFSAVVFGFTIASHAQTAAEKPATPATEVKTDAQPSTVAKKDDAAKPAPAAAANTQVKKECAGHGSSGCAKGEAKSCCKAKTGASASATPASQAKPSANAAKASECKAGENKGCCKKNADGKTGS